MTLRKNKTKGERFSDVEQKISQMEMATRMSQMMIQQIGNSISAMAKDLGELASRQREVQYRLLALQDLMNIDVAQLSKKADDLQIKDFNEASDKEDAENGYIPADEVTEDSVVILTSTTPDEAEDRGYFRSKVKVKDIGLADLRDALIGKKKDETFEATVNKMKHVFTVLGVRSVPTPAEEGPELGSEATTTETDRQSLS